MPPRPTRPGPRIRTRAVPASQIPVAEAPTEGEIRQRAYEIYLARGAAAGDPVADWRQAEVELRGRMVLLGRG